MSIFKKDCPQCAAPNTVDALQCECGYCFDPDALAASDATAYAEEQDRLYLDYLAARIAQAEAEAIVAREQAHAAGGDTYKGAAALVAEQTLSALQAEMKQLASRVVPRPKRAPMPPPAKPAAPVTLTSPAKNAKSDKDKAPQKSRFSVFKLKSADKPKKSSSRPFAPPANAVSAKSRTNEVAARSSSAPMAAPAAATPKVAHRVEATRPTPPPSVPPAPAASAPKSSTVPNTRFRVLQARKAEAIARAMPPNPAAMPEPSNGKTAHAEKETEHGKSILHSRRDIALQSCPSCGADVALNLDRCHCGYEFSRPTDVPALTPETPIMLAPLSNEATQECPNCTAVIPVDRNQCNCGYTFSRAEQVPAISLDAGALSILTDGLSRSRRR